MFYFSIFVLFFFLVLFCFSFYLTVSLYVLSLRWPWSLSWACKMCKAKICVEEKKFLYSNYNEEQWVLKKRLAHNFSEKKKEKEKIYRRLQTSPIQVVKFCSSASSLVFCLQVPRYICYLIKTARKERKKSLLTMVGVSVLRSVWQCFWG